MNIKALVVLSAFLFSNLAFAVGKNIETIADGPPAPLASGKFPQQRYKTTEVHRLRKAKLVWANLPLLKQMGYEVPPVATAEFQEKLLHALSWIVPDKLAKENEFSEETKTMYSDYYGGTGLGANTGSARAASAGEIQIKGVGITGHIVNAPAHHTGRSTLHESIKDALWGEVLNNELPYGANRIIAIIDRGDELENGEPQMLEIRMDPIRMGHFVMRKWGTDAADIVRTRMMSEQLAEFLPSPSDRTTASPDEAQKIILGMNEYAKRIGVQYGQMYMLRLFHGATSESNIEINGRMIDFGTASAQPGFEAVLFLPHVAPFGDVEEVEHTLIEDFATGFVPTEKILTQLQAHLGAHNWWQKELKSQMIQSFKNAYEQQRIQVALRYSGVPKEIIASTKWRFQKLGKLLVEQAKPSSGRLIDLKRVTSLADVPESDLNRFFNELTKSGNFDKSSIHEAAGRILGMPQGQLDEFSQQLEAFYKNAFVYAKNEGVTAENFSALVRANANFYGRPFAAMYLPELRQSTQAMTEKYIQGDTKLPAQKLNDLIQSSYRDIQGLARYEAPLRNTGLAGHWQLEIFNAKTGQSKRTRYVPEDRHLGLHSRPLLCRSLLN